MERDLGKAVVVGERGLEQREHGRRLRGRAKLDGARRSVCRQVSSLRWCGTARNSAIYAAHTATLDTLMRAVQCECGHPCREHPASSCINR